MMQRMAKQTAAAQKRAEAEARKMAKLGATSAAASSQVDPIDSQAAAVGSHARKGTAKEVESASGITLPQTTAGAAPQGQSADGPKAESQKDAESGQEKDVATAGSNKPQPTVGSGNATTKPTAAAVSARLHDENQASNGAIPDGRGQLTAASLGEGGQAGSVKARAGKKRAAEVHEAGEDARGGQSRSTRSKTGTYVVHAALPCLL